MPLQKAGPPELHLNVPARQGAGYAIKLQSGFG
jgi:hypothetical protein